MVWSGTGWYLEGLLEELEPRQSCCNQVFSRRLWHHRLGEKQKNILEMCNIGRL